MKSALSNSIYLLLLSPVVLCKDQQQHVGSTTTGNNNKAKSLRMTVEEQPSRKQWDYELMKGNPFFYDFDKFFGQNSFIKTESYGQVEDACCSSMRRRCYEKCKRLSCMQTSADYYWWASWSFGGTTNGDAECHKKDKECAITCDRDFEERQLKTVHTLETSAREGSYFDMWDYEKFAYFHYDSAGNPPFYGSFLCSCPDDSNPNLPIQGGIDLLHFANKISCTWLHTKLAEAGSDGSMTDEEKVM